ncbi:MAG: Cell division ATP-binding protein FtsE [candidate division WS2 bacterium]|uniref:Cell division ATP-binding protein FtsE n=1 Tax=Psychracetigena formicireducens TaxID=2986056 RepID=A0A9E2BFC5_PSYF1|nr:Cell division ATP-binding protein FtsE [Candidatus Psychracetigena formicireducens]MBT9144560.1 Cell division ATP-binding protein FtsE [Candidatus Psychracetigena formicireducens]
MIEFRNVTKSYNNSNHPAVANVSLRVERGEFIFLVGPSGAGKSTIMKLLFREIMPTTGQLFFIKRNIINFTERDILKYRRLIGMVFQDFRLLKQKNVYENVAFALEVLGQSPRKIRQKVPVALEKVGLTGKEKAFPSELSGGEAQRVGIARAIVKDPLIILADEPTGNVDRDNSKQIMKLFESINENGTTVIVATHAWDLVDRMQKRVIALKKGRIIRDEQYGGYATEY